MKVALDISPLQTGHKVRGIGSYTQNLSEELKKNKESIDFEFFSDPASPPPADVIHYPYFDLFFHTLPTSTKTSRVVTIHDVIPLVFPEHFPIGPKGFLHLFLQKRSLKNTHMVICNSKTSKEDIANKLSYPKDRIRVTYLAPGNNFKEETNINKLKSQTKKFNLPKEFALYVGDVNWNKNISGLLESIKISKIDLVMVGASLTNRKIAETELLEKLIKNLNLNHKVHRLGYISEKELIALYNLASVTLQPSFYEGFGFPVLESMICGTPVVCSNVASLSEIAGDAAIFCDPQDPTDIARKTSYVLNLSVKAKKNLAQMCIAHAGSFSWKKVARQTIEVYKSLHD